LSSCILTHYGRTAEALYNRALAVDPHHVGALLGLAQLQWTAGLGDVDAAVRLSKRAVEACPSHPIALARLAALLETAAREPATCEAAYRRACDADRENGRLATAAACFLASQGRIDDAEAYHRRGAQAAPSDADVLGAYADFLRRHVPGAAAARKAEALFQRALAAAPRHENNLMRFGALLRTAGRLDEAEALYKRAVAAAPTSAIVLGNYANFLCRSRRDTERARGLYLTALKSEPQNATVARNYALFLRDFPEARRHRAAAAAALDPRFALLPRPPRPATRMLDVAQSPGLIFIDTGQGPARPAAAPGVTSDASVLLPPLRDTTVGGVALAPGPGSGLDSIIQSPSRRRAPGPANGSSRHRAAEPLMKIL
jgi:Tfp pilus assembly protein PilF